MDRSILSGEDLFFRYAFPCADGRRLLGKIDDEHYARLKAHAEQGTVPKRSLLRYCFPHAYRRLREWAEQAKKERWDLSTVREFWRNHHGHTGECRVRLLTVKEVLPRGGVRVEEESGVFLDQYSLSFEIGDISYVHMRTLVEKVVS